VDKLPKLVDHEDETQPLDARARSYLHSNCSHCHMKWGGGNADFLMLYTLPLDKTGLLSLKPNHGTFGVAKAGLIVPGHPERSMVHYRMTKLGLGRMPHIASSIVDEKATKLIGDWIKGMK